MQGRMKGEITQVKMREEMIQGQRETREEMTREKMREEKTKRLQGNPQENNTKKALKIPAGNMKVGE